MGKRSLDLNARERPEFFHQAFDYFEKRLPLGKRHFDVHLREFGLAVGAEIFVAETTDDLKVAVRAADHQKLLE